MSRTYYDKGTQKEIVEFGNMEMRFFVSSLSELKESMKKPVRDCDWNDVTEVKKDELIEYVVDN